MGMVMPDVINQTFNTGPISVKASIVIPDFVIGLVIGAILGGFSIFAITKWRRKRNE